MKPLILAAVSIWLAGCTHIGAEYKCQDGVIYIKNNGAWIQTLVYKDNKCLPVDGEGK